MKRIFCILLAFTAALSLWAQPVSEQQIKDYVATYKNMAILEMSTYKIPASITLAQAIYASKAGTNHIAKEANNHFGITCHANEWVGDTFYETEDRSPDHCYRKYADVENSYRDHSLFLSKRPRYASLFELDLNDYRAWAKGLKEAGYAGNPRYADTLIAIIEKYDLAKYDDIHKALSMTANSTELASMETPATTDAPIPAVKQFPSQQPETPAIRKPAENSTSEQMKSFPTTKPRVVENVNVFVLDSRNVPFKQAYYPYTKRPVYENNKTKFILAKAGDTNASLAATLQMSEKNLRLYNDVYDQSEPIEDEVVYLEMKSTKSPVEYHTLNEKDTYHYISQKYGVQLKIILKRNSGSLKTYKTGDKICISCK